MRSKAQAAEQTEPRTVKPDYKALLKAIAKVNGHPDPEGYADAVHEAMEAKHG